MEMIRSDTLPQEASTSSVLASWHHSRGVAAFTTLHNEKKKLFDNPTFHLNVLRGMISAVGLRSIVAGVERSGVKG